MVNYQLVLVIFAFGFSVVSNPCFNLHAEEEEAAETKSVYARLGGQEAINLVVDNYYAKVLEDDRVNYLFEEKSMKSRVAKQKQFLSAALGGPESWDGRAMSRIHKGLDLTEEHYGAIAEHFLSSLQEQNYDDDLIGEVMAVITSIKGDVLNAAKGRAVRVNPPIEK